MNAALAIQAILLIVAGISLGNALLGAFGTVLAYKGKEPRVALVISLISVGCFACSLYFFSLAREIQ